MAADLNLDSLYGTPIFTLKLRNSELKKVYGASYSGKTGEWRFPAFYPVHQFVISDLQKIVKDLTLSAAVNVYLSGIDKEVDLPKDFSFITEPYKHQEEGVRHLYRNIRAGLFYSPGLGKCKITVDLQRLTNDSMLVLCPKIMLGTWAEEFVKHGNIEDVIVIDGSTKKKKLKQIAQAAEQKPVATIITYGVATLYTDEVFKIPYDCIVADESHQMKSAFAKRTKASAQLATRAYRRVLLTGTPSLGSPFDMYGQLRFLGTYFCKEDWWSFRKMFGVYPAWEANENVPKMLIGFKNLDLMNERVNLVCLRKTKEECLDLPDQTVIDMKFPLHHVQKKAYNSLILERCDAAGEDVKEAIEEEELNHTSGPRLIPYVYTPEVITLLNKLDQINSGFLYQTTANPRLCDGCPNLRPCTVDEIKPYTSRCSVAPKAAEKASTTLAKNARLEECKGVVETIIEDEENKVIIWANYKKELDQIGEMLTSLKVDFVRVQGGLSRKDLTERMDRFNKVKECRVYLGQVSTGIGVTLNAANYTVYYNLPWSLEHYQQSLDRNYRIGQDRKVTVYRLVARHTLDEAKAAALDQKMDFSALVTKSALCATCHEYPKRCSRYNIKLYDTECIYDRKMMREKAEVKLIP